MSNSTPRSVSVIVPAFNEAATIGQIVRRIKQAGADYEVIVIDDGSEDDTANSARTAGATVIRNPYNLGNGASVKAGCLAASGDVIVMIDADGQHPPEAIPELVSHIGEYDMVVASRIRGSNTSPIRRFGNLMLNAIGSWVSGRRIADLTSGFRAIKRRHLLEYIHLFPTRYSYPTTITIAMIQGNHFVKFLPLPEIQRRLHGHSHVRPFQDFLRFLNIMARLVVVFSPQRFFLPLSAATAAAGLAIGIFQLVRFGAVLGSSLLLLISSLLFFCFGLVAEQIAALRRERREHFTRD